MKKVWEDYKKPVPIKWRKIGDFSLVVSTFLSGSLMGLPIDEHQKLWSIFILNFISTCIKFFANAQKESSNIINNQRDEEASSDPAN